MAYFNPYFNAPAPGIIPVQSEQDVIRYPVAPGNSLTFRLENTNIFYTKTMGASQFEQPVIERFRMVKDTEEIKQPEYATKAELDELREMLKKMTEADHE